ncbi:MAG: HEAT repeat domain-containing protein [Thermoleophilaceae bacterium]
MANSQGHDPVVQFDEFRDAPYDIGRCRKAVEELVAAADRAPVVALAQEFIRTERVDEVRAWGMNVLERLPDPSSFDFLSDFLNSVPEPARRRSAKYSRMYAVNALEVIATTEPERRRLYQLLEERWSDDDEDALPRALAAALGLKHGRREARVQLETMFQQAAGRYWYPFMILRALRECPVEPAVPFLLSLIRDGDGYIEIRHRSIELLARFAPTPSTVRAVGEVLVNDPNEYLRLSAAVTLGELGQASAQADLIVGVTDANAEVRVRAATALERCSGRDQAVTALVAAALASPHARQSTSRFVDALRLVDPDRTRSTEVLSKELGAEDRGRAQRAEGILLELGGWSAVQRLSQRRATLDQLDALLQESEAVVQRTFEATVRQAQRNFYFALGVNVLVVAVGLALSVIAILHLIEQPEDIEAWLLPGGAGVLGILINLAFNNPRKNARDDLATLVNVNVLFLGFLRQLNEIDATFKHAYIEGRDFGADDMRETVARIESTVGRTLSLTSEHLSASAGPNGAVATEAPAEEVRPAP